jgi:predicted lipoprotein
VRQLAVSLILVLAVTACSSGPAEEDVVSSSADLALVSAIEDASSALDELATAVETFCTTHDDETHVAAKEAWAAAKTAWERSEWNIFIGPADMLRTLSKVDYEPISEAGIDELLASDTVIDLDYVENRAASTDRGLGAVEYILFRELEGASEPRACHLSTSASRVASDAAQDLAEAWTVSFDGGEPWVDTFTVTVPSNQALGDLVAAVVETTKRQSLFEIGQALGISAPDPEIESIPEGSAGAAAEMYEAQLAGIRDLLDAGGEDSLGALIRARSAEVADRIDVSLDSAMTELAAIDEPLRQVAADRPGDLEPVYQHIAELRTLFESDVVSLLDITLGFSDTDGDTG